MEQLLEKMNDAHTCSDCPDGCCKCCGGCIQCNDTSAKAKKKKIPWYWLRDTSGNGSVTVTILAVAFWVTTLAYFLSLFDFFGKLKFKAFDVSACSTYFIPILTLYFGRKWTDAKFGTAQPQVPVAVTQVPVHQQPATQQVQK